MIGLDNSEEQKHDVLQKLDEQAEGEPSEDVVDVDQALEQAGLRPDPDGNLKELDSRKDLTEDEADE
ncbi:hypothetical protein HYW46_02905 [Candidatus Daviesbacteria bacterium]|nr:hypothetical protein [Candidatus Daviesbacteria bacterium]